MTGDALVLGVRSIRQSALTTVAQCDAVLAFLGAADTEELGEALSPERVTCPKCGAYEHQAPAGEGGEYVCGIRGCGANHKNGEVIS